MMRFINLSLVTLFAASLFPPVHAAGPKIAWYGQLKDGLAEAKRSGRPILLVSAAPQCQNVSGMW